MKKLIIILSILTLLVGGVAVFYYLRTAFPGDALRFEIDSPERVEAGERMQYTVRYRNNRDTRLEDMILTFEYPENAIPLESENENIEKRGELRRVVDIGELNPGEEGRIIFEARLLGRDREPLESSALIRYRPKNLSAHFEEERTHVTYIESVPIEFEFDFPASLESNKENTFRLEYESRMNYALTDLEIRMQYPDEFDFVRSRPQTSAEKRNRWVVSVLNEGDRGFIEVDGILKGRVGEARTLRATLGVWRNDKYIPIKEASRGTSIAETTLFLDVLVNRSNDYIASPGEMLHYEVIFKNLGEKTLENLFLMIDLDENVFDLNEVESLEGRKSVNSILWSYTFKPEMRSLAKNEEESVEFWAKVKEDNLSFNPTARIEATIENENRVFQNKINTKLSLTQEALFENTPFELEDPVSSGGETTINYAARWELENYFNDVRDVTIKTILPENVDFIEGEEEESDYLSFDPYKREVLYTLDELSANSSKEIFFNLEIVVPEDIDDESIRILSSVLAEGEDKRTEEKITKEAREVLLRDKLKDI